MNEEKTTNAITYIDEKYIKEYAEYKSAKKRVNALALSGIAACLCIAIALPVFFGQGMKDTSDRIWPWSEAVDSSMTVGDISVKRLEIIHDAYVKFNGETEYSQGGEAQGVLDFPSTLYCHLYEETSSLLVVKGRKVFSDSYTCDIEEDGTEKKLRFTVTGIKIHDVLKKNNTSGYAEGDVIYLFEHYIYIPAKGEDEYKIFAGSAENEISVNEEAIYLLSVMNDRSKKNDYWKVADSVSQKDTWRITCVRTEEEYKSALKLFAKAPEMFEDLVK